MPLLDVKVPVRDYRTFEHRILVEYAALGLLGAEDELRRREEYGVTTAKGARNIPLYRPKSKDKADEYESE